MHDPCATTVFRGKRRPTPRFDLAFAPQVNDYNSRRTVKLKVLEWRPAQWPSPGPARQTEPPATTQSATSVQAASKQRVSTVLFARVSPGLR